MAISVSNTGQGALTTVNIASNGSRYLVVSSSTTVSTATLSCNGVSMTKHGWLGGEYGSTCVTIWGLTIPDAWAGGTYNLTKNGFSDVTYAVFRGVSNTNPPASPGVMDVNSLSGNGSMGSGWSNKTFEVINTKSGGGVYYSINYAPYSGGIGDISVLSSHTPIGGGSGTFLNGYNLTTATIYTLVTSPWGGDAQAGGSVLWISLNPTIGSTMAVGSTFF